MTRAFLALARGDLAAALAFHPLAPVLAVQALVLWLFWGAVVLGRVRRSEWTWGRAWDRLALGNAAALIVLWVVRLAFGTLPV